MLYNNQIVDIVVPVIEPPCDDDVFHLHRSVVLCDEDVDMFNLYICINNLQFRKYQFFLCFLIQ